MAAPLLLDLTHTSHTRARTGIQRVTRSLLAALGERAVAVTHDPHRAAWRTLEPWETENLRVDAATAKRGAHWPLRRRLQGRAARLLGRVPAALPSNGGLIVPEIFSPAVGRALPALFAATSGRKVALFHDAIALRLPELTPSKTVARFPAYLVELLAFDGIAAVSEESAEVLIDYWRWLGAARVPVVHALPLGLDLPPAAPEPPPATGREPTVLSVGSIEGRKNHLALLEACEERWQRGDRFTLHLIGLAHPQTGAAALSRIAALQAAGRPLRYDGPVTDAQLEMAYAACTFTVYPSLSEGFGLPVMESVVRGKPCVCLGRGALGESARGGGCVLLENVSSARLADAIGRLVSSPPEVAALAREARQRPVKRWADYANELVRWMDTL